LGGRKLCSALLHVPKQPYRLINYTFWRSSCRCHWVLPSRCSFRRRVLFIHCQGAPHLPSSCHALKGFSFRFMLDSNSGIFDAIADQFISFSALLTLGGLIHYPSFGSVGSSSDSFDSSTLAFPITPDTVWLADDWSLFWMAVSEVWGWAPLFALMFRRLGSIPDDIFNAARRRRKLVAHLPEHHPSLRAGYSSSRCSKSFRRCACSTRSSP